jgi:hypothetical protein
MSTREHYRFGRRSRHLCAACRERKAKFQYEGHVRADRDHVLCFQCYRSLREQTRAQRLASVERARPARLTLTAAEIDHRVRMLAHMEAQVR